MSQAITEILQVPARPEREPERSHAWWDLDWDRLQVSVQAVLEADRERIAPHEHGPTPLEQAPRLFLDARHERLLLLVQHENSHRYSRSNAITGLVTLALQQISPRDSGDGPFRAHPQRIGGRHF
jgi:hypothetical protein